MSAILTLPNELLNKVFDYLDPLSALRLAKTNRQLKAIYNAYAVVTWPQLVASDNQDLKKLVDRQATSQDAHVKLSRLISLFMAGPSGPQPPVSGGLAGYITLAERKNTVDRGRASMATRLSRSASQRKCEIAHEILNHPECNADVLKIGMAAAAKYGYPQNVFSILHHPNCNADVLKSGIEQAAQNSDPRVLHAILQHPECNTDVLQCGIAEAKRSNNLDIVHAIERVMSSQPH
ncbi:MAG: hypothetical protein RL235_101 [Chlamydiota bacterium]|jgi:hypothetical protein